MTRDSRAEKEAAFDVSEYPHLFVWRLGVLCALLVGSDCIEAVRIRFTFQVINRNEVEITRVNRCAILEYFGICAGAGLGFCARFRGKRRAIAEPDDAGLCLGDRKRIRNFIPRKIASGKVALPNLCWNRVFDISVACGLLRGKERRMAR